MLRAMACLAALALGTPLPAADPVRDDDRDQAPVEVVNVATCTATLPRQPSTPFLVRSNGVQTPVLGGACAGALTLALEPAGSVHPGDILQLEVHAASTGQTAVSTPELVLTLPPPWTLPLDTAAAAVTSDAGDPLPFTGSVDVPGRRLIFQLPDLPAGDGAVIRLPLQLAMTALGSVTASAELSADGCAASASASVTAEVVPFALALVKRADRTTAWPGDAVGYTLEIAPQAGTPALGLLTVVDTLPEGFRYVPGTARVDGVPAPDPAIGTDGRTLRFALGPLPPDTTRVLGYAAVVGPGAREGDAANLAQAEGRLTADPASPATALSPQASATVRIRPGPFRREAILQGQVFVDD
ncbi:MAG TPA: DUF11 domain-containing protein, partial [Candidatus Polarisedimenticolaceae bacterium]|nr:DUF11 domain-containing protein [Candidatus Polarisedimenticolaceae bacterium]